MRAARAVPFRFLGIRPLRFLALLLVLGIVSIYGAANVWAVTHRDVLLYGSKREATKPPSDLEVEEVEVRFEDRRISVWDVAPLDAVDPVIVGEPDGPTVLYLHGTDTSLNGTLPTIRAWHALGYRVIAFDYRGFGESTGKPSGEGLVRDAQ